MTAQPKTKITQASPFKDTRPVLRIGVAVAAFLVVAVALATLSHLRQEAENRAALSTQNLAQSIELTIEGLIDTIDVALLGAADEIGRRTASGKPDRHEISAFLMRQKERLPNVSALWASNEVGDLIYGTDVAAPLASSSGMDHFIRLRDDPTANLLIAKPVFGRLAAQWTWIFARRINKPNGDFAGIVFSVIPVDRLNRLLAKVKLDPGTIALRDADWSLITRLPQSPRTDVPVGDHRLSAAFVAAIEANPREGTYSSGATGSDEVSRTYSYRRSDKYGFAVDVGIPVAAALHEWKQQVWIVSGLAGAFILALLIFATLIDRAWRQQAQNLRELDASRKELDEAEEIAGIGRYAYDLITDRWTSSEILDGIFGIDGDYSRDAERWLDLVAGECRDEMRAHLHSVVAQRLPFDHEYRIVRPGDGDERWVHGKGKLKLDAQGTPFFLSGTIQDITQRKRIAAEVMAAGTRLQTTLDAIPDPLFELDEEGRIHGYHSPRKDLLAVPPEVFLGKSFLEVLPREVGETCTSALREAQETGFSSGRQYALQLAQGTLWFELSVARKPRGQGQDRGFVVLTRDISRRKRIETELRQKEHYQRALLDNFPFAVWLKDTESRFLSVNSVFARLFGVDNADELAGKTDFDLFSREAAEGFRADDLAVLAARDQKSMEEEIVTGGKLKWFETYKAPVIDDDGEVLGTVGFARDITFRKEAEEQIRNLAFYDPLTQLPNRRLMLDRLEQALVTSARHHLHGALMLIDMDNFKTLNDTLGHDVGDQLLVAVASRLQSCVREGDTVARMGGDEFVVILEDLDETGLAAMQAESVSRKILDLLSRPYVLDLGLSGSSEDWPSHHCSSSIGVALFLDHSLSVDELLKRADTAMYQAKAAGRNTLRFFDPDMQAAVTERAAMEADLRRAIADRQFQLHYQAQLDSSGRIVGAEALLRWQHPERGMVAPASFIPLSEDNGLILPLGQWVLETACSQLAAWATRSETDALILAVNVSARQFRCEDFVSQVLAALGHSGANPERLKLELTETLLVEDIEDVIRKMTALKAQGVSFSLDDFGTGYSSLAYLKRLPIDELKIDKSFVRDVLTDANDAAISRTIVALGQTLGFAVIAEGVETEAQREFLASIGCHVYQGFVFSRPLPAVEFDEYVRGSSGAS